ncbi:MAG: hypothetical protein AB1758_25500 [Candidatus Eremiobacterota bacterium]
MICLKCGTDNLHPGPACETCGFTIGLLADGRGFLPQIHALRGELAEGKLAPEQLHECLHRLELALSAMIYHMDQTGAALAQLGLDETQTGVLGGFLLPLRESMEKFLETARTLESSGEWPEESLEQLEELQIAITRGSEGVAYLIQTIQGFLMEKVAAGESLEPLPTAPQETGE